MSKDEFEFCGVKVQPSEIQSMRIKRDGDTIELIKKAESQNRIQGFANADRPPSGD